MSLHSLLLLAGLFTTTLGIAHFFFPALFGFSVAIPASSTRFKTIRLPAFRHQLTRDDLLGIILIMNHAASYTLVAIGLLDLFCTRWVHSSAALPLALWIAGWWLLRATLQLRMGMRPGDFAIFAGFAALGVIHLGILAL